MLDHLKEKPDFHYLRLANELESKIMGGEYAAGDRLPSLRKLHKQLNLSISTVYQAYIELGVTEARIKSGFYVKPLLCNVLPCPKLEKSAAGIRRFWLFLLRRYHEESGWVFSARKTENPRRIYADKF